MSDRPPVWQLVREAIHDLGGKASYPEIKARIRAKYGDVNDTTMTCVIIVCSVNHPSRIHYPENKKPRRCTSQYDFLFNTGRGKVELYDSDIHGDWEIYEKEVGVLGIRQCNLTLEPSDPGETLEEAGLAFPLEAHLRDFLVRNIRNVRPDGVILELFEDDEGRDGREYPTDVGPIDILAVDSSGGFVVFELKLGRGPDQAVGQLLRYMGWVQRHMADGKPVRGVIVAAQMSDKIKYAVDAVPSVTLFEYEVAFSLKPATLSLTTGV